MQSLVLGNVLIMRHSIKRDNQHDQFAVAILEDGTSCVVGHIPREISRECSSATSPPLPVAPSPSWPLSVSAATGSQSFLGRPGPLLARFFLGFAAVHWMGSLGASFHSFEKNPVILALTSVAARLIARPNNASLVVIFKHVIF